jgi:hypothetical protein
MSLKLGNVFLRPSPQFTLRHINPHEKVNTRLAEQSLTIHCLRCAQHREIAAGSGRSRYAARKYPMIAATREDAMTDFKAAWEHEP